MIDRGTQKKMIVLKRTGSPYFSEVYFILRDGDACKYAEELDMAAEAERIISRMTARRDRDAKKKDKQRGEGRLQRSIWFLSGALCGVGLAFITGAIFH